MKTKFLFLALSLFTLSLAHAQDSTATPSTTQVIATKGDSLMVVAATRLKLDTNETADELGQRIDELTTMVPGKHAGPVKWLNFLIFLFGTVVLGYFAIKHGIVKGYKAVTGGASIVILGLAISFTSCATLPKLVGNMQTYVEKHCPSDTIKDPLTGNITINWKCDSLWNTQAIKSKCPTANVCVDIANASFSANLGCPNVLPSVSALVGTLPLKPAAVKK